MSGGLAAVVTALHVRGTRAARRSPLWPRCAPVTGGSAAGPDNVDHMPLLATVSCLRCCSLILRVRNPSSSAFVYREPTPDEGMNSEQETGGTAQTSGQRGCFIVGCLESSVSYLIEICDSLFPAGFSPCDPAAACSHDRIYPACRGAVLPAWPTRGLGGKMATSV